MSDSAHILCSSRAHAGRGPILRGKMPRAREARVGPCQESQRDFKTECQDRAASSSRANAQKWYFRPASFLPMMNSSAYFTSVKDGRSRRREAVDRRHLLGSGAPKGRLNPSPGQRPGLTKQTGKSLKGRIKICRSPKPICGQCSGGRVVPFLQAGGLPVHEPVVEARGGPPEKLKKALSVQGRLQKLLRNIFRPLVFHLLPHKDKLLARFLGHRKNIKLRQNSRPVIRQTNQPLFLKTCHQEILGRRKAGNGLRACLERKSLWSSWPRASRKWRKAEAPPQNIP